MYLSVALPVRHHVLMPLAILHAGGADYSGPININIRGSSSARYSAKKSFSLKIRRPANATVTPPANSTDDTEEDYSTSTAVGFMGQCGWMPWFISALPWSHS